MNKNGYQVSVALAPKSSNDQVGLLYEGKDYKALGEAANYVLLMTYEWGYTYGPPMAVAPIHLVEEVVKYAITEIVPEKILLGIPNYGYDWTLPFEKGNSKAKTLGNIEAIALATEKGSSIQYDKQAQSPYFKYWEEGYEHEVWFEDARSMQAKMDLIHKYHLLGGGIWQIMRLFRPMNLVIKDNFYIQKFE